MWDSYICSEKWTIFQDVLLKIAILHGVKSKLKLQYTIQGYTPACQANTLHLHGPDKHEDQQAEGGQHVREDYV